MANQFVAYPSALYAVELTQKEQMHMSAELEHVIVTPSAAPESHILYNREVE